MKNKVVASLIGLLVFPSLCLAGPGKETIRLSLQECIQRVLEDNLGIRAGRIDPRIADTEVTTARSEFDPNLSFDLFANKNKELSATQLSGAGALEEDTRGFNTGLEQKLITGGTYNVDWTNQRYRTNSQWFTINPSYSSGVDLGIRQPLLRNFGIFVNKSQIMIAMNNMEMSEYDFKQSVIDTVAEAENIYWDLTFAIEDLEVSIQSYNLSEDLVKINQAKVAVGTLPPVEVLKAQSTSASRKETIIISENTLRAVRDKVLQIANMPQLREAVDYEIVPVDKPEVVPVAVDQLQSMKVALERRPDYLSKKVEIENRGIELRVAKNQLLPVLDLEASLGSNGLGGNYANDLDTLGSADYYNWGGGLALSIPLGNRLARSTYKRRKLEVERALIELKDLEQDIIVQIRGAVRDINSDLERVRAARVARKLASEQLSQEQKRFDVGRATTHDVLEYQDDFAQAQKNEMSAMVDYLQSLVALERAKGTLLEKRNVVLEGLYPMEAEGKK